MRHRQEAAGALRGGGAAWPLPAWTRQRPISSSGLREEGPTPGEAHAPCREGEGFRRRPVASSGCQRPHPRCLGPSSSSDLVTSGRCWRARTSPVRSCVGRWFGRHGDGTRLGGACPYPALPPDHEPLLQVCLSDALVPFGMGSSWSTQPRATPAPRPAWLLLTINGYVAPVGDDWSGTGARWWPLRGANCCL